MATFFVGQRVRIIRAFYPENLGREGFITSLFPERESMRPGWPVNCAVSGSRPGYKNHTSCLEPILPDGHRACDEDFKRDLDQLLEREGVSA